MRLRVLIKNEMYSRRDRYGCHIHESTEYEGEVYPNPPWVKDDSFCLTTGDSSFPFRVLSKDNIIHGWTNISPPPNVGLKTYQVKGSNGKMYIVTKNKNSISCNCTGYSYRKTCTHIIGIE